MPKVVYLLKLSLQRITNVFLGRETSLMSTDPVVG